MSTRASIHFQGNDGKTNAIIYRHHDGYPKGLGKDLKIFLQEVKRQCKDTRFDDPSYLAAKFIVWQSVKYAEDSISKPLNFLGIGICIKDPGDIEYKYLIKCKNNKLPVIKCARLT
jgi:hypothetical protein